MPAASFAATAASRARSPRSPSPPARIGTLTTSAAALSFKPWERVEIVGRDAFLVVEDQFETTLYDEETGPAKSWRPAIPNTLIFDEIFGGYAGLLEHVLDAVRGRVAARPHRRATAPPRSG